MKYLILLLASFLMVGCNEKQATQSLILAFLTLSEAADAQVDSVNRMVAAGKIEPEEAEAFTRWTEPLIQASTDAVNVLAFTETPFEARVLKALHIFTGAQQQAVFEKSNNPLVLSSYLAVDAALRTVSVRFEYAKAKSRLEKQ